MCLEPIIWGGWREVNIKGYDTKVVVITSICDKCLPMVFSMLDEWGNSNLNIRIEKKFVTKYSDKFNVKGWHIDPRYWNSDDPLRFCRYASVESRMYISPTNYS